MKHFGHQSKRQQRKLVEQFRTLSKFCFAPCISLTVHPQCVLDDSTNVVMGPKHMDIIWGMREFIDTEASQTYGHFTAATDSTSIDMAMVDTTYGSVYAIGFDVF